MKSAPTAPLRQITLNNRLIEYRLRISTRIKNPRLTVSMHGLEVVLPVQHEENRVQTPQKQAISLMNEHADWLIGKLDAVATLKERNRLPTNGDNGTLLFRGKETHLVWTISETRKRPTLIETDDNRLEIRLSEAAFSDKDTVLERLLIETARKSFEQGVQYRAAQMQVTVARITLRNQKTRWGSCSRTGNLSFNWRLIFAPPAVLDYLIVHELAHRIEMNHSPRFWQVVQTHCSDYKRHRNWLKENGWRLQMPNG